MKHPDSHVVVLFGATSQGRDLSSLASAELQVGVANDVNALKADGGSYKAVRPIFGGNALAVQALKNGQIDGLVVDLPTAFYITAAQVKNSIIVGQLPSTGTPEQFGALLAKGSPLTSCVSKAIDALKDDGTLAEIQDKWLAKEADAPVLR